MPTNPLPGLDLLSLAEDVAEGRRALDNVIDQIAVATPDDRERRRAVAELQSLVVALAGVRSHARATAAVAATKPRNREPAHTLVVRPQRVVARRASWFGRDGVVVAGLSAVAIVVVMAVVAGSLHPGPSVGGPSPSGAGPSGIVAASPSSAPSSAPSSPPSSAPTFSGPTKQPFQPPPTAAPDPQPVIAFWRPQGNNSFILTIWRWDAAGLDVWFRVDVLQNSQRFASRRVLVAPNGRRIAIAELGAPGASRVSVFDDQGVLLWTSPKDSGNAVDLAWSADGTRLAYGTQPRPWTVVTFSPNGSADATTYDLPSAGTYRLIAFTGDGNQLVGYETSGEAEFWDKPVSLDLAKGVVRSLSRFPAGLSRAATGPVQRIDPLTGDVLAISRAAKGPAAWVVRRGTKETALPVSPQASLAWSDDGRIIAAEDSAGAGATPQSGVSRVSLLAADGSWSSDIALLPTGHRAEVVGFAAGRAIVVLFPSPSASYPMDPGYSDVGLVRVSNGETVFAFTPPSGVIFDGLEFAGWISPSS